MAKAFTKNQRTEFVQMIIDEIRASGHLTMKGAQQITGATARTTRRYFTAAINIGNFYRSSRHGAFLSETAYFDWRLANFGGDSENDAPEEQPFTITRYNRKKNAICTKCRQSPAMQRVLMVYGVTQ